MTRSDVGATWLRFLPAIGFASLGACGPGTAHEPSAAAPVGTITETRNASAPDAGTRAVASASSAVGAPAPSADRDAALSSARRSAVAPPSPEEHEAEVEALRDVVVTLRIHQPLDLNCFPPCLEMRGAERDECERGNLPMPALDGELGVTIHNGGKHDVTIADFGTDALLFVDAVTGEADVPMIGEVHGPDSVVVGAGKTESTSIRYDGYHGEFIRPGRYRVSYRIRVSTHLPELPVPPELAARGPDKRIGMELRKKVILDPTTWSGQSKPIDVVIPRPAWCSQADSPWLTTTMFAERFRETCALPSFKKK